MNYFPQQITEFTYSNAVDTVEEFNPLTSYSITDYARVGSWNYKSTIDLNVGNEPLESLGVQWFDGKEPSNSYAMIDLLEDTTTDWVADGVVEFTRGGLDSIGIGNFKASQVKIEYLDDINGVVSGLTIATSVDLNSTVLAGLAYVDSIRVDKTNTAKLFTASKDTYVDLQSDGTLVYTEVANGAGEPTLTSPNERLARVVTDVDNITSVTDLRTVIDPVLDTDIYTFSVNGNVWDLWSYIYGGFTDTVVETIYTQLKRVGTTIRVTFSFGGNATYCGYFIVGIATDMGATLDKVKFPYKKIGKYVTNVADFKTIVDKVELMRKTNEAKLLADEVVLFVIDPSETTSHNNMIILGKITKCEGIGENLEANTISWQIEKNIQ